MFEHSSSHNIRKDRVILLRAMRKAATASVQWSGYPYIDNILAIIADIKSNHTHFLSVSQEAGAYFVSYARRAEDKYNNKRRFRTTLGRYIDRNVAYNKKVFVKPILNAYIEAVLAILGADSIVVRELKGQDIMDYYANSPSSSCMTNGNSIKTELYALNPDKVSLLVYDEIRALAWTCDDGAKVLDRAYPAGHFKIAILREWAERKGYILRTVSYKLVDSYVVALTDGKSHTVTVNRPKRFFPYMDTFAGCNKTDDVNRIILHNGSNDCDAYLRGTHGEGLHDPRYCRCCRCSMYILANTEEKTHNSNFYCGGCFDTLGKCFSCNCAVDTARERCFNYEDHTYCHICALSRFKYCTCCDRFVSNEMAVTVNSQQYAVCVCYTSQCVLKVGDVIRTNYGNNDDRVDWFVTSFIDGKWCIENRYGQVKFIQTYDFIDYYIRSSSVLPRLVLPGDVWVSGYLMHRLPYFNTEEDVQGNVNTQNNIRTQSSSDAINYQFGGF